MAHRKPPERSTDPGDRGLVVGVCLFLAVAVFLIYGQTLRHEFVAFDDSDYVFGNPHVSKGLSIEGILWAFSHSYSANWHPLTWISHMLDCQVYGLNAGGHHLTNVLLHAATAILLFLVLRRMVGLRSEASAVAEAMADKSATQAGALWPSAFVAAVFAVHPLHVESVAWVAERKDVLSGFFFVLTLWTYASYVTYKAAPARRFYVLSLFFFALGLMSKPMLVTLPFVLLLLDYWPLRRFTFQVSRFTFWPLVLEKAPFFLLAAAASVVTFVAQGSSGAVVPLGLMPLHLRLANGLVSYGAYLLQTLWPVRLAVLYPHPAVIPPGEIAAAGALLVVVTALAIRFARRIPCLPVGWFWFLGMLLPVIGFVQVGEQARADRYMYLPQIGLCLMVAWGVKDLTAAWRWRRQVLGTGMLGVVIALGVVAWRQTGYWRNSELLWTHTLACTANNATAHKSLGSTFVIQGHREEARAEFLRAIELKPDYAEAYYNLGVILADEGNEAQAVEQYRKAIQFDPANAEACNNLGSLLVKQGRRDEAIELFQRAVQHKPDYPEAHYNLGLALAESGRYDEAANCFQNAIQSRPGYAAACHNLGNVLAAQGRLEEAIAQYQRAIQLMPELAPAHYRLGVTLQTRRNFGAAAAEYRKVLALEPKQPAARLQLAWLLATCPDASLRNGAEAVELAQQARELAGSESPQLLDTLAAAYAEAGRFPEAVAMARQALDLAGAGRDNVIIEALQTRLHLYQANSPYHEKP
jgi:protein O-mannosyl-transferase